MLPRNVPYENNPPRRHNIVTVVMPGITSCRSQLSRYTGGDPLVVLHNWSDVPATDPLHLADAGKNRYSGMPLVTRLRRAWRIWKRVVLGWRHGPADSEEDDDGGCTVTDAGEATATVLSGPGVSRRSQPPASAAATSAATAASSPLASVKAADLGLTNPPVLYSATCRIAPRLIHGVLPSPEVAEVRHHGWYRTLNPFHWALTVKELMTCWWFSVRPFQWCYSEPGRTNTAGLRDQAAFTREVRRAVHHITHTADGQDEPAADDGVDSAAAAEKGSTKAKRKHLVLFGVSRGATTCFYSAMKLPEAEAQHVSLVLVEAPFDTMEHVIAASCWTPRLMRWFARSFSDWRGTREERLAYDFDPLHVHLRCPVAFVMSTKDRRVPAECTQALIERVRRELVPHVIPAVEVLVLQHSRHPAMAVSNKEDQDAYVAFVEMLYDKYCPP